MLFLILKKLKNRIIWTKAHIRMFLLKFSGFFSKKYILYEFNEFTWDMVRLLPRSYYYIKNNRDVLLYVKPNLESLYYYTSNKKVKNIFSTSNDVKTYNNFRPNFTKRKWLPPPLKDDFKGYFEFDRPSLIIQNKYTMEFSNEGIFNYFSLEFLDIFFKNFKSDYQIIYIRPKPNQSNYYEDKNEIKPFKDYELIQESHPEVKTIYDFLSNEKDFNLLQFKLHATSEKHLSVSGGNACLAAYFGGELIIFDSPNGKGAGRGIWKDDSWLKHLSGSKIKGFNNYTDIINYTNKKWK